LVADKANFASSPFAVPACFVLLVYGLSWMIEVPAALTALGLLHVHVSKGLQTLAQLTPAVAALITAGLFNGRRAIGPLLLPLLKVHTPFRCYALALLVAPATQAAALLLYQNMGHSLPQFGPWSEVPVMGVVLALFSVGEEIGWRGFFLPNLMKGNSLLAATGWMALFWGFWHLPFYLAANSEGQSTWLQCLSFLSVSSLFQHFSRSFTHEPEACFSASSSTDLSMLERPIGSARCRRDNCCPTRSGSFCYGLRPSPCSAHLPVHLGMVRSRRLSAQQPVLSEGPSATAKVEVEGMGVDYCRKIAFTLTILTW